MGDAACVVEVGQRWDLDAGHGRVGYVVVTVEPMGHGVTGPHWKVTLDGVMAGVQRRHEIAGAMCSPGPWTRVVDHAYELTTLLAFGSGNRAHSARLVEQIRRGELRLPQCFNVRGGTPEQTARAHELARLLTSN